MIEYIRTRWKNYRQRRISRQRRLEMSAFYTALEKSGVIRLFIPAAVWGCCILLLVLQNDLIRGNVDELLLNQQAPRTVISEFDFSCTDSERTAEEQQKLRNSGVLYFNIDRDLNNAVLRRFTDFVREQEQKKNTPLAIFIAENGGSDTERREWRSDMERILNRGVLGAGYQERYPGGRMMRVCDLAGRDFRSSRISDQADVHYAAREMARGMVRDGIASGMTQTERLDIQKKLAAAMENIIGAEGNLKLNEERTERMVEQQIKELPPVKLEVRRGDVLLYRGKKVTAQALEKLRAYNSKCNEIKFVSGQTIQLWWKIFVSLVLMAFVSFYLYHIHPDIVRSNKCSALLAAVVSVSLFAIYAGEWLFRFASSTGADVPPWIILMFLPLALSSVCISVMLGFRVSVCAGFFVVAMAALMIDESFQFVLRGVAICAFSALAVRSASNYRAFFMRTVMVLFPLTLLLHLPVLEKALSGGNAVKNIGMVLVWAASGSAGTAIAALLIIFLVEIAFNVTTNMALMVLCDYSHPLLERLKLEAPGTFFHSMMVATLSENAAQAIRANPLKAKVAALFHDIGKLSNPQYFAENNIYMGNQHETLNPQLSSLIIREHVKEGMELARQYKLCRTIRDSIAQHHGNSLIKFFYSKALKEAEKTGTPVSENQFRYGGEPPKEKEIAIVSLADACEAACRALQKPSPAKIEEKVGEIFRERFADGQLSNAALTLKELRIVQESFIKALMGIRHGRVEYKKPENLP